MFVIITLLTFKIFQFMKLDNCFLKIDVYTKNVLSAQ